MQILTKIKKPCIMHDLHYARLHGLCTTLKSFSTMLRNRLCFVAHLKREALRQLSQFRENLALYPFKAKFAHVAK